MQDSKRDTDVKNRLLDSVAEGEGGMIWQNNIETCILPYVKQITHPSLMHEIGHSKLVHWDNPERWDGEGGGRWVPWSMPWAFLVSYSPWGHRVWHDWATHTHKSILTYLFEKLLSFNILTPCLSSFKFILHNPRYVYRYILDSQSGASGKEPVCQCWRCKRLGFNPWVRRIPWKRAWQLKWLSMHIICI